MNEIKLERFIYAAKVLSVYDGDTITVITDLGFRITQEMKLRLARIDTPELREPTKIEGLAARDYVRERILDKYVIIRTYKDKTEKYGRYLADVFIDGVCLNDELVAKGFAVYREY